jgi:hypothetical protein
MARVVHKHPVYVGETLLQLPRGARFLSVQVQNDQPQSWWLVDPNPDPFDGPLDMVRLVVIGTGHHWDDRLDHWKFLGTFQLEDGAFVGHLFQERDANWAERLVEEA